MATVTAASFPGPILTDLEILRDLIVPGTKHQTAKMWFRRLASNYGQYPTAEFQSSVWAAFFNEDEPSMRAIVEVCDKWVRVGVTSSVIPLPTMFNQMSSGSGLFAAATAKPLEGAGENADADDDDDDDDDDDAETADLRAEIQRNRTEAVRLAQEQAATAKSARKQALMAQLVASANEVSQLRHQTSAMDLGEIQVEMTRASSSSHQPRYSRASAAPTTPSSSTTRTTSTTPKLAVVDNGSIHLHPDVLDRIPGHRRDEFLGLVQGMRVSQDIRHLDLGPNLTTREKTALKRGMIIEGDTHARQSEVDNMIRVVAETCGADKKMVKNKVKPSHAALARARSLLSMTSNQ
jgi:hypothetical protein